MTKTEMKKILNNAKSTYDLLECRFRYPIGSMYYYVCDVAEKFVLVAQEDDFLIDGFQIRKIADLTSVKPKDGLYSTINKENDILCGVDAPPIDLSSWKSIFESLKKLNIAVIIENDNDSEFLIGYIKDIKSSLVTLSPFDADGVFDENVEVAYSDITNVSFLDRYSVTWNKYLCAHGLIAE